MVITFLGGWFEIFRDTQNFESTTLLAVEWEVRFAHFLYQKIFIVKKWPNFKHFFSQNFSLSWKKYLERADFWWIFFSQFFGLLWKTPHKMADFSADFFSQNFGLPWEST